MRIDYTRTSGPCWRCKKVWKHDTRNVNAVCPECKEDMRKKAEERTKKQ